MAIENCVTFLPCSDIKKTTHFYRDIVGLPVVQEQAGGNVEDIRYRVRLLGILSVW